MQNRDECKMEMKGIRLGERQDLVIVKQVEFGVYLAPSAEKEEERVMIITVFLKSTLRPCESVI